MKNFYNSFKGYSLDSTFYPDDESRESKRRTPIL